MAVTPTSFAIVAARGADDVTVCGTATATDNVAGADNVLAATTILATGTAAAVVATVSALDASETATVLATGIIAAAIIAADTATAHAVEHVAAHVADTANVADRVPVFATAAATVIAATTVTEAAPVRVHAIANANVAISATTRISNATTLCLPKACFSMTGVRLHDGTQCCPPNHNAKRITTLHAARTTLTQRQASTPNFVDLVQMIPAKHDVVLRCANMTPNVKARQRRTDGCRRPHGRPKPASRGAWPPPSACAQSRRG